MKKRNISVLGILLVCLFLPIQQIESENNFKEKSIDKNTPNLSNGHYVSVLRMKKLALAFTDLSPYLINITEISGDVWDLKEFDDNYINMTIDNRTIMEFGYQLALESENISQIQYISTSFSIKTNSTMIFMLQYRSQTTGAWISFTLHNQHSANVWLNWTVEFVNTTTAPVGGWDEVNEPFVCVLNGMFFIRLMLPYNWEDKDVELCLDNVHSNIGIEEKQWIPDSDTLDDDDDDDDEKDEKDDTDDLPFFLLGFFGGSFAIDGRLTIIIAFVVTFIYYDSVQKIKSRKIKR